MWSYIQSWYDQYGLVDHQLASYNHFVTHDIKKLITETTCQFKIGSDVYQFKFDNVFIPSPAITEENRKTYPLTPQDCRERNLTYSSPLYVSVTQVKNGVQSYHFRVLLAHLPVMIGSCLCTLQQYSKREQIEQLLECPKDPGGYFVINGIDRVLVTQQRNIYNTVQVFPEKEKYSYRAEIRSISEETNHSILIKVYITRDGRNVYFHLPFLKSLTCMSVLMKALGFSDVQQVVDLIGVPEFEFNVRHMFRTTVHLETQLQNLAEIGMDGVKLLPDADPVEYARQVLNLELFPHLGMFSTTEERLHLLCLMIRTLLQVHHQQRPPHDKDHLAFKRYETSGILMFELFKSLFRGFLNDLPHEYEKRPNLSSILHKASVQISKNIKHCFATGNWGVQKNNYIRQGVSQMINRLSYLGFLSHLRRVVIPIGREGKNFKVRQVHPTHLGFICLFETPEGGSVGIVSNFALSVRVSVGFSSCELIALLKMYMTFSPSLSEGHVIFVNGIPIGSTRFETQFSTHFRELRQKRAIPMDVSIFVDTHEILIYSDKGRLLRPFLKMPVQLGPSFAADEETGAVQWLDTNELQQYTLAMYPWEQGDYCELHPSLMYGVCAGSLPFTDHMQAPRTVYASSMNKQALGLYSTSYRYRSDAVSHILNYPQKSLVSTQIERMIGTHDMPAGINCIVAIMTYTGYNQEDSIIINKSAVDRGLFQSTAFFTYCVEERKERSPTIRCICVPPPSVQKRGWNYYHLDHTGLVRKGAIVRRNDVIVGRTQKTSETEIVDCSVTCEKSGVVDQIQVYKTPNGYKLVKIILRQLRIPELGDKLASTSAQKSTIGAMYNQEDMPFTKDGIVPDLIMNPLAMPSRMTISQLLACVLGKVCLQTATPGDATPFSENSVNIADKLTDQLHQLGYERFGHEAMVCGFTGKMLKARVFIGPTYYQKLKHMISDKCHSRAVGSVTQLTRQPLSGRAREGGLRLGEMERDALISHGSSQFLRERLFDSSDPFTVLVCNGCGNISNSKTECQTCFSTLIECKLPFATKLFLQSLQACSIKVGLKAEFE
jgi:DNA-directed RNA polymerase II subunit RPB2